MKKGTGANFPAVPKKSLPSRISRLGFDRRCGMLAPGRSADLAILRPSSRHADPSEAVLDPATQIAATLRRGRVIAGSIH